MLSIYTALLIALTTLIIGIVISWFLIKKQKQEALREERERYDWLERQWKEEQEKADKANEQKAEADSEVIRFREQKQNMQEKLDNQKDEIEKIQKDFKIQFENLANKIFEEKSKKFTDQNKEQIEEIVKPYEEQLAKFKKKVQETHEKDIKAHSTLIEKIKTLSELNERMREEAVNLTRALKSDTKKQGSWGEFVLERILETSGLQKGREYETEVYKTTEDGKHYRPDVVIHLPEEKKIVIDSKVSLSAYERYINEDENRDQHLKDHLLSLNNHIKELGQKNYHSLFPEDSPEFILLFIPIEPALTAAINADSEIFQRAFEHKVVLVTPTTLLATLKTISSIWKNEYRNRHVLQIADEAGKMYDKFELFVEALRDIGTHLKRAQKDYETAEKRLVEGRGNLISKAEKIRELGAKAQKKLPEDLIRKSGAKQNKDYLEEREES